MADNRLARASVGPAAAPRVLLAWLVGLPARRLGRAGALALLLGLVVAGWAVRTSWGDVHKYGGTDLRTRVLGARLVLEGQSPYYSRQDEHTPERLFDPDRIVTTLTRCTYTPATLLIYVPLAAEYYARQRVVWMILEWSAFFASVLLLARAVPGATARVWFTVGALVFFAGDWSMRLHVERGQYYVFLLLLMSLGAFLAVRWRRRVLTRADGFAAGVLFGVAAAMRPSLVVMAGPLLLLRRWRMCAGLAAGAALAVAATLPLAGPSRWGEYFKLTKDYETLLYEGPRALDPPPRPQPMPRLREGERLMVEGADFTEILPKGAASLTFGEAFTRLPERVRTALPLNDPARLSRILAVAICGAVGLILLAAGRRVSINLALACAFGLVTPVEYLLPIRFSYADVLCLPTLAMLAPFMTRRRARPWAVALAVLMIPSLLAPGAATVAVRSLALLAVPSALALWVMLRGISSKPHPFIARRPS